MTSLYEEAAKLLDGKLDSDIVNISTSELRIFLKEMASIFEGQAKELKEANARVENFKAVLNHIRSVAMGAHDKDKDRLLLKVITEACEQALSQGAGE